MPKLDWSFGDNHGEYHCDKYRIDYVEDGDYWGLRDHIGDLVETFHDPSEAKDYAEELEREATR